MIFTVSSNIYAAADFEAFRSAMKNPFMHEDIDMKGSPKASILKQFDVFWYPRIVPAINGESTNCSAQAVIPKTIHTAIQREKMECTEFLLSGLISASVIIRVTDRLIPEVANVVANTYIEHISWNRPIPSVPSFLDRYAWKNMPRALSSMLDPPNINVSQSSFIFPFFIDSNPFVSVRSQSDSYSLIYINFYIKTWARPVQIEQKSFSALLYKDELLQLKAFGCKMIIVYKSRRHPLYFYGTGILYHILHSCGELSVNYYAFSYIYERNGG